MVRPIALTAAIAVSFLAVSGASGVPAQTPKLGGTLVYRLIGSEPACLNILSECSQATPIIDAVLLKPFEIAPNFTYRPRLATARFTKKRPFTLTYRIRPGARWSDGKAITAQDFVFTLHAIRTYGRPESRELHRVVRSIHVVDAKTVRVVLRPRSSAWRELFGNILPAHALRGADLSKVWSVGIDDPRTGEPIGSGPFLVERWDRGRGQFVLRRNPAYWGPHAAYLGRIVVRFIAAPADPRDELRDEELDVATGIPPDLVPAVRREPGVRVSTFQTPTFEHLDLQLGREGHPALRNKLVRRALAYGIDRAELVRKVYEEIRPAFRPLDSDVLQSQSPYYEANWSTYRYRPARARELLEQAGCRRGDDGIYSCAGRRLSLRLITSAGFPSRARALPLIQQQLRRAGIEAIPVFAPPPVFFGQILPGGNFDAALFSWTYAPGDSWSSVYGCQGADNHTGYCRRLVTAHLNAAGRILDAEQQAHVLNQADVQLARDVPTIPLYQFVVNSAQRADVRGYVLTPPSLFWNAENWWLDR